MSESVFLEQACLRPSVAYVELAKIDFPTPIPGDVFHGMIAQSQVQLLTQLI